LRESPSLKREVEPMCRDVYPDAVRAAAIETLLDEVTFPQTLPYTARHLFERELPADQLPKPRATRKNPR
jgi:hypothetical protein